MHNDPANHEVPPSFWRSRYAIGLLVIGAVAAYFLLTEHFAHVVGALPLKGDPHFGVLHIASHIFLGFGFVLLVMYGRLAVKEEKEMRAQFGAAFDAYANRTPHFLPHFGQPANAG